MTLKTRAVIAPGAGAVWGRRSVGNEAPSIAVLTVNDRARPSGGETLSDGAKLGAPVCLDTHRGAFGVQRARIQDQEVAMFGSHGKLRTICLAVLIAGHMSELRGQREGAMVSIPDGPFMMGAETGAPDERPVHIVELSSFLIDRNPVTKAQFALFLEARGRVSPHGETYYEDDDSDAGIHQRAGTWVADPGLEDHPVLEVTWVGARDYCAWANKRLPTEAEWEKAARGTDGRAYPWGNQSPDRTRAQFDQGRRETSPVGHFPDGASPYGVLDMAGNVWEWVSSAYRLYPYDASDGRENLMPGPVRVTRGGGHDSSAREIRSTERGRTLSRDFRSGHRNIGFRCAR